MPQVEGQAKVHSIFLANQGHQDLIQKERRGQNPNKNMATAPLTIVGMCLHLTFPLAHLPGPGANGQ